MFCELSAVNGSIGKEQTLIVAFASCFVGEAGVWSSAYASLADEYDDFSPMSEATFCELLLNVGFTDVDADQLLALLRADFTSLANNVQRLQRAGYRAYWMWFVEQYASLQRHNPHLHEHYFLCLFHAWFLNDFRHIQEHIGFLK